MNKGGIAVRLINLAKLITGRAPGALAQTNVLANMLFGSISGSGTAAASAMGSIIGPIEKEEGYDPNFSAAVNIATAPTGLLIPPSNVMITYSLVSGGTSVAALFMAGYIPGILWGLACMLVIYVIAKKKGYRAKTRFTLKEGGKIVLQALPCLLLIVIVIGGIITGIFTATEGSVVAVVYSLILSLFVYRSISIKEIPQILRESAEMTGIIIFLIGVSSIMSWVMAFTNIPSLVSSALLAFSNNEIVILLLINVLLLIVGTFMDMTPACLIFTPIFLPVCTALGMDPIHFSIMMIFNLCIGTITPPVGTTLFVGVKVGKVQKLFHEYAEQMPIVDYHCHINPQEIAEDRKFENITQVWLGGDHYKWRQMRSNGVDEYYITGEASDREKFQKWAETLGKAIGNPLYH